jgi:hypothetical protein
MLPRDLERLTAPLVSRVRALEVGERSEITGSVEAQTVTNLPAAGQAGRVRFATDGRKIGEGAGAGTGVIVYDDGTAWRRTADDTTVVA